MSAGLVGIETVPHLSWYLLRATGLVLLVVYTVSTALGISSRAGTVGHRIPRFVSSDLHRRIGLFSLVLLLVHVATAVVDNYVVITWTDAVVPFVGSYRPLWLALGTLALDLLVAVVATSLLRHRIGPRTWKVVHLSVYATWPLMVLHGLGTGTDARKPTVLVLTFGCLALVLLAAAVRLLDTPGLAGAGRLVAVGVLPLVPLALALWTWQGPLAPGWSQRAGTPAPPSSSAGATR